MSTEIQVVKSELDGYIHRLAVLSAGTRYRNVNDLSIDGYSDTEDALNQLYQELVAVEDTMMEVLAQTKQALTNAGVQFEEADWIAGQIIGTIGQVVGP